MEILDGNRSVVVIVDLQGRLAHAVHESAVVLEATRRLLRIADLFAVPVILTEQYPQGLGPTEASIQEAYDALSVPKRRIAKTLFGCCGDQGFETALDDLLPGLPEGHRQVVVAGIEAHVCVMQTALELLRRGSQVHLCAEAISGRGKTFRRWALERMQQAGAVLTNHESAAFEWARGKDHPRFRELNRLLREGQIGGDQDV
ncbi:MAG TPA: isochorismatase family protein [Thermoanaerobaculia bacterium]|nr:isochorismatase family protein [Thermoanaerobaculia bacterium]